MSGDLSERGNFDLRTAAALRGMGGFGAIVALIIVATVLVDPLLTAVLVLVWVWLSRTPIAEIGFVRPGSWASVIVLGVITGVAAKLLMKAVVLPYFGAPATNPMFAPFEGNLPATLETTVQVIVLAALPEEIVFRGFLFNRLQTAFGTGAFARLTMIVGGAVLFGALHYVGQGFFGALNATIMGLFFGAVYFLNKQRLWFLIVSHASFDVCTVWLAYLGVEARVAHAVFG